MKIATCSVNNGLTVMFWKDLWDLGVLQWRFPQLFSFARLKNISCRDFLSKDPATQFWLPMSQEAAAQLVQLQQLLDGMNINNQEHDVWSYIWGSSIFTTKQAYKALSGTMPASPIFKWLWNSCVQGRHRFFFWLLVRDRLNTRNILRRKNMVLDDYNCVLCQLHIEEDVKHIFFDCPFSKECWALLGIFWDTSLDCLLMVIQARQAFGLRFFREVFILACWTIWEQRNGEIFENVQHSLDAWRVSFRRELSLAALRAKASTKEVILSWLSSHL